MGVNGEGMDHSVPSFKDKLVGDILSAFSQALDLSERMGEDLEAKIEGGEIQDLREGLAAVKTPKAIKQRIRV